jgi:hypothetical protein
MKEIKDIIICDKCGSDYVEVYNVFPPRKPDTIKMSEYLNRKGGAVMDLYIITHEVLHCRACDFKIKISF